MKKNYQIPSMAIVSISNGHLLVQMSGGEASSNAEALSGESGGKGVWDDED